MKICQTCRNCYEDKAVYCLDREHGMLTPSRPGGRLITEKYRLDSLLGRGGMGAVYAGTHVELDRPVAIKLLLQDFIADPQALERFRREARAAARINHPNVASVYDFGLLRGGEAYLVMELVDGQTLREYMDAFDQFPLVDAVRIAYQVADGIEAAHRQGIIHRDLKPSNIILTHDVHEEKLIAKVADFGIAKLKEHSLTGDAALTASGAFIGTPRYTSPEQCRGDYLDARSDIYSLGIILYEMITGAPPYEGPTAMAIALKHIQDEAAPIEELRPEVSPEFAALVRQAMRKEPEARPQSAAEFARSLRSVEKTLNPTSAAEDSRISSDPLTTLAEAPDTNPRGNSIADPPLNRREPETARAGTSTSEVEKSSAAAVQESALPQDAEELETVTKVVAAKRLPIPHAAPQAESRVDDRKLLDDTSHALSLPPLTRSASDFSYLIAAVVAFVIVSGAGLLWLATRPDERQTSEGVPAQGTIREDHSGEVSTGSVTPPVVNQGDPSVANQNVAVSRQLQRERDKADLRSALDRWIRLTNEADLQNQVKMYMPTVTIFYRSRNASHAAVRAEKSRLYSQSDVIDVRAGDPEITFSRDGRNATMRFRKDYMFGSGAKARRGAVLQELQWQKTDDGWKITAERDLSVMR